MLLKKSLLIALLSFFVGIPTFSQSLLEDVNNLVKALDILDNPEIDDSTAVEASAKVIAILHHYSQPLLEEPDPNFSWEDIKGRYAENALINNLIKKELIFPADSSIAIKKEVLGFSKNLKSGDRQAILKKIHAEPALSPADYLSVSSTLEKYRQPVFPPIKAMQIPAQNSNQNLHNGALNPQAAIIEGLFLFILDRAKDEFIINFLDRFINEETPEFEALFPAVVKEFKNTDLSFTDSYIARMRELFYEDIQLLSVRLPLLMLNHDYFESLQSNPVIYNLLVLLY